MSRRYSGYDDDEETASLFSYAPQGVESMDKPEVEAVASEFVAEVEAAQQLGIHRNLAMYVEGRMKHAAMVDRTKVREKRFHVPKLYKWDSGEPEELIEDLRQRRVRARLQARTGLGKSTRLAPLLANALQWRVLVVSLNALALRQSSEYIRAVGIGRVRRNMSSVRGPRVCYMTYAGFNGYMCSDSRVDVFKSFELIIFDEAFEAYADVYAAKRAFAMYSTPEVNLLLCSATISAEAVESGALSAAGGAFEVVQSPLSLDELVASGKLVGDRLVDRTFVVLPTDAEVSRAADYYADHGVTVAQLDSAALYSDFEAVIAVLRGDSVCPRVVVMHHSWAIGFNMELEFGIVRPFRGAYVEVDGVWKEVQFPMSEEQVVQARSRTGRNIGETSGGFIVGAERAVPVELYESERERAFFLLLAMHIEPLHSEDFSECYAKYPSGFAAHVAHLVLTVNLPPSIVVRFLADDGLVAAKYANAISMFTQNDHYILPSKADEPALKSKWVMDDWVDHGRGIESRRMVPVHAVGELQCVLHGIVACADGELNLVRYRPPRMPEIGDYDSDGGVVATTAMRLRRLHERALPAVPTVDTSVSPERGFELQAPLRNADGKRLGVVLDTARVKEALSAVDAALASGQFASTSLTVRDTDQGPMAQVAMGVVNSPGGSVVCELPAETCEIMNEGRVLPVENFLEVLRTVRTIVAPFVASRLFDGFAGPWESYLATLMHPPVSQQVQRKGELTVAYAIVDQLKRRLDFEMVNVMAQSVVTRSLIERMFKKRTPKASELYVAIERGDFRRFGQSKEFFRRVLRLREMLSETLVVAESAGYFVPTAVTAMQRGVQWGGTVPVGSAPRRWVAPPEKFGQVLQGQSGAMDRLAERFSRTQYGGHGRSTSY